MIKRLNKVFSNRKKDVTNINGFAFIEDHIFRYPRIPHIHVLIKDNDSFKEYGKMTFPEHLYKKIDSIGKYVHSNSINYKRTMTVGGCDVVSIYDENTLIDYLLKKLNYNINTDFIKPLSKNGIDYI